MKNIKKLIFVFLGLAAGLFPMYSQTDEEEIEKLLRREVEVENPVYMPVLGVGVGYYGFYGNVNDAYRSYTVGKPGIRVNVATFLGRNHYFRGNLTFMMGGLTGTQRFIPKEPDDDAWSKNMNFKSDIYSFGLTFHYSFKPLIRGKLFEPFISVGIETVQFDSKADYFSKAGSPYYYWTDGTIRDDSEKTNPNAKIISRDYNYETDIRMETKDDLGMYSQFTAAIPVDVGIDFNVSNRVTLRAATSLHYAFTDLIDGMSSKSKVPEYKGKSGYNMYSFSYLSLHLDLFSSPKTKIVEDLFANIDDMDLTMWEDQDGDGVFDGWDLCPDTPPGIPVDSIGCPFDSDNDGVPDYLDREPNSHPGAIVDEYGVEINENMVIEILNAGAIRRSDVESYLLMHRMQNKARRGDNQPIPAKFKPIDINSDGYLSFDELLKVFDDYFDGSSGYSPNDIRELIDYFFEQ